MAIAINLPVHSAAFPTRLGPLQQIHGTCSGPNPSSWEIGILLDYTDAGGTLRSLLGAFTSGLNGGNTWHAILGLPTAQVPVLSTYDDLAPDGQLINVSMGFAAPPSYSFALTDVITGQFLWSPQGAWWRAWGTGGGLLDLIYAAVRKQY